jgi:hypothetical protein
MNNRTLNRPLDWIALHMHYFVCPVLVAGLAMLVAVGMLRG